MNFKELMARMAELDQPVQESDKAAKDYDGDGEVESGKDEYMGSRDKAIKQAMGKDDEAKESLDQLAMEVQQEVDECGMGPMGMSSPMAMSKQQDNVSMNINMTGSGSGGIRDLMDILRNIEQGADDHHDHDDGLDMKIGQPSLIMKKDPVLGDEFANSPEPMTKTQGAFPQDTGDDLHSPKGSYPAVAGGDNPMALESIVARLDRLYKEVREK
jgi:hypothetical protein